MRKLLLLMRIRDTLLSHIPHYFGANDTPNALSSSLASLTTIEVHLLLRITAILLLSSVETLP